MLRQVQKTDCESRVALKAESSKTTHFTGTKTSTCIISVCMHGAEIEHVEQTQEVPRTNHVELPVLVLKILVVGQQQQQR